MRIILANQFKNESLRIVEWLEYHRDQGITDFILVNDHSTDDSIEKIRSVSGISAEVWPVELSPMNFLGSSDTEGYRGNELFSMRQATTFKKIFEYVKDQFDQNTILGFIDCDEFIFNDLNTQLISEVIQSYISPYAVMSISSFEVDSRRFILSGGPLLRQTTRSMSVKKRVLSTRNFVVKSFINFTHPLVENLYSNEAIDFWMYIHLAGLPLKTKKKASSVFLKNLMSQFIHLMGGQRQLAAMDSNFIPQNEADRFEIKDNYLRIEPRLLKFLHYRTPSYDLDVNGDLFDFDYQLSC